MAAVYEYKVLMVEQCGRVEEEINQQAREGWRVVHVARKEYGEGACRWVVILERERKP